jgi:hypothetical protein
MRIEFVDARLPSRRAWAIVLAIAALAAVTFAVGRVMTVRARSLESTRIVPVIDIPSRESPRSTPTYDMEARRALDRASLPWSDSLAQLEGVSMQGVQLRSIDVDMASRQVRVELAVSDDARLADYLDQLNAGAPLAAWCVVSVTGPQGRNPQQGAASALTSDGMAATIAARLR